MSKNMKNRNLQTEIERNPFAVLGATTRDDRRRIVELAEERSLTHDNEACSKARTDLTNPRNRLAAEMAWLPGLSPRRAMEALSLLRSDPQAILGRKGDPPLAFANLMASAFELIPVGVEASLWSKWIIQLAETLDRTSLENVVRDLNEERAISDFSDIRSADQLEEELDSRKRAYKNAMVEAVDRLPTAKLVEVMTCIVVNSTGSGEHHAPSLVDDLVDSYELRTQKFLRLEADGILKVVDKAKQSASMGGDVINLYSRKIEELVKRWFSVAHPILLSKKSRGLEHDVSRELAQAIRGVVIHFVNEHKMFEEASSIMLLLKGVFGELPEISHQLDQDVETLEERKREHEEWKKELVFTSDIGDMWNYKILSISHEGIKLDNAFYPLETISRTRWGGVRDQYNRIMYKFSFGDDHDLKEIETESESLYNNFTQRLWKAVGVRIIGEMIAGFSKGRSYKFGPTIVWDDGVDLETHKPSGIIGINKYRWDAIRTYSEDGSLHITLKTEPPTTTFLLRNENRLFFTGVSIPYRDVDNVHMLEAMLDVFLKKGGNSISAL